MMKTMLWEGAGDFQQFLELVTGQPCEITIKPLEGEKLRTAQQNKALHKDFRNTADILNANDITADMLYTAAKGEFPVTEKIVKEYWHGVLSLMGLPPHTSKLSTKQVSEIREAIERAIAIKLGVDIGDFPSIDGMSLQSLMASESSAER